MKRTTTTLLAAILFTGSTAHGLTCPTPKTQTLVGLWESRETSKGGIGHTVEFRQDGTFVEATTVMVNFTYHVSGDRLTLDEAPGDSVKFRIEGDTFLQTQADGSTLKKSALGRLRKAARPSSEPGATAPRSGDLPSSGIPRWKNVAPAAPNRLDRLLRGRGRPHLDDQAQLPQGLDSVRAAFRRARAQRSSQEAGHLRFGSRRTLVRPRAPDAPVRHGGLRPILR
jgi:hypothetical protein